MFIFVYLYISQTFILLSFRGIKNYDYDKPKWTEKNGCFIQLVYSTVKKFAIATASYSNNVYVIGRFDQPMYGPYDIDHVPKPKKGKKASY